MLERMRRVPSGLIAAMSKLQLLLQVLPVHIPRSSMARLGEHARG